MQQSSELDDFCTDGVQQETLDGSKLKFMEKEKNKQTEAENSQAKTLGKKPR